MALTNIIPPNKKKFTLLLSTLLLLSLGVISLLFTINKSIKNKQTDLTNQSGSDKVIALSDKPFYIELTANPSTGYQWQADFDTKVLKLNKVDYAQPKDTNAVGSEVAQTFEFQPLEKTNTSITFKYVRPWETDTPPTGTKSYNVVIQ